MLERVRVRYRPKNYKKKVASEHRPSHSEKKPITRLQSPVQALRNLRCQDCGVPADEFGQDRKVAATICPSLPRFLAVFFCPFLGTSLLITAH